MSLLDKFKKKFEKTERKSLPEKVKADVVKPKPEKEEPKEKKITKIEVKDKSGKAGRIILRPLQTEKVTDQIAFGQYSFEVTVDSSKSEIIKAVEAIYDVKPIRVHTVNMRGKSVRFGRVWSKRKNWKKAIVTLKPGDKIEVYEGL